MSRRNGRPRPRGPDHADFLRELDSVAVGVVDVDEPHLPVQLDDRADVDALRAQPLGLRPEVRTRPRDSALLAARLRERDLHLAALELRPARRPVDERLLEAERLR